MIIHRTITRPYAKAIFDEALAHDQLEGWYRILFVLAKAIENKTFSTIVDNPNFSKDQSFEYLSCIYEQLLPDLNKMLKVQLENFIKLLLRYKRLAILPDLFEAYQQLCYQYKKISIVHVTSAFHLSQLQKEHLNTALEKYFNTKINASYTVDRSLIGGLMVQTGNLLIDGSIKNQLKRLKRQLIQT